MLRLANVVTDVTDVSLAERQCFGSVHFTNIFSFLFFWRVVIYGSLSFHRSIVFEV